nr:hypothetical protein [Tanacetum cinerariifolium]
MGPPGFPPLNVQNNQNYNRYNQNQGNYQASNNQGRGQNFNQGNNNYQALNFQAPNYQAQVGPLNELTNYMKSNEATLRAIQTQMTNMKTDLRNEFKSTIDTRTNKIENQNNQIMNMLTNLSMQKKNPSGSRSLPSNIVANSRGDLKAITTRSGVAYDGPTIPPTLSPLPNEVERETKATKDKKLSLPDLTPTCMTLKLATRSFAYPAGIAEDVFMQVGKITFSSDFVVIDYDVDPRVPLILGRPFLRMARALVDVHGEELILRDDDEQLIFYADSTLKHPHKHKNESVNIINFIDITCEDFFLEVLKFNKSNHPSSGSTTPLSDFSPSLTPLETSDSFHEKEIEYLLNQDPSTESKIKTIEPILEKFTEEPALDYLPPPGDDDDDIFDLKSDNDELKKLLYVVEARIVKSNDLLLQLLDNDSAHPEDSSESSEIATLSSSSFKNKEKVFNPVILILGGTQIFKDESKDKDLKDKDLIIRDRDFLSISSDQELLFFLELTLIETLLALSSKNADKVFNPKILILNGVYSFIL